MLLIHDLAEIYAGDAFVYDDKARLSAKEKEDTASSRLFSMLPDDLEHEFHALRDEFEKCETDEAKFAHALDGLQPLINHLITGGKDFNPHGLAGSRIRTKKEIISETMPALREAVEYCINKSIENGLYTDK